MLNLALVALLSGSLLTGSPGDDDKDKRRTTAPTPELSVAPADTRAITNDTYAFGRPSDASPIKFWVAYAYGESESVWAADGETVDYDLADGPGPLNGSGDIISQRAIVGAQINVLHFPAFKLGIGGQLIAGTNKFEFGEDSDLPGLTGFEQLESGWGLQNGKVFGSVRGRVVGLHGGYYFDLADDNLLDDGTADEADFFPLSDNRDAIFVGADFDYPSERFRVFGGIDYFMRQDDDEAPATADEGGNNLLWFNMGAGLRFSVFEIGAAFLLQTTLVDGEAASLAAGPRTGEDGPSNGTSASGGHAGTVAPYLKISPPSLPVSLFVKGAVLNEYTDYGYAIGGGNDIKPSIGFTAGLTVGFD